ncbi:MAG: translation initiation factor IF-3 [Ilumatobacter sp.]|jgi:translation initiation factor IF-3
MARGLDLDLVEVAPQAKPPVCRIMDYGKFKYEEDQKAKEARKKSTNVSVKEVKYRPKIGKGDFDTKTRNVIRFIDEGHKVKVTLQFRGREMAHPELGAKILDEVIAAVGPAAKLDSRSRLEGRAMSMVLSPDKQAQEAIRKAAEDAVKEAEAAAIEAATEAEAVIEEVATEVEAVIEEVATEVEAVIEEVATEAEVAPAKEEQEGE